MRTRDRLLGCSLVVNSEGKEGLVNIPFQVRVPVDRALTIDTKLKQLRSQGGGDTGTEKYLSASNILRLAIIVGLEELLALKPKDLITRLTDEGVARGRPRRVA